MSERFSDTQRFKDELDRYLTAEPEWRTEEPAPATAPQMPSNILTYQHECSECGGPLLQDKHDYLYCEECGLVL